VTTSDTLNIAVIGAGITGITTAYNLAKRGARVTIFDRHPYAAMETSFANGGQLSASNAEVWNSWATVLKGLKWMTTPGAPLLVNPKQSWHKFSWMMEFIRSIPKYEENTVTTVRLALEAREHLRRMAADEGIDFDCEDRGILHFYETRKDWEAAERVTALLAKGGLERRAVTQTEIHSIEPALRGNYYGGFYMPSDFTGDIHKFTNGLAKACQRIGVEMRLSDEVLSVSASNRSVTIISQSTEPQLEKSSPPTAVNTFDRVVVCGGVMSRELARALGDRVNIYPVKGYSITVPIADAGGAPESTVMDETYKVAITRLGDRIRAGGTAEISGYDLRLHDSRRATLEHSVGDLFPKGGDLSRASFWCGLRPMTPDGPPIIGATKYANLYLNTGHGTLGWTMSCGSGRVLADIVSGRKPDIDTLDLSIQRYG